MFFKRRLFWLFCLLLLQGLYFPINRMAKGGVELSLPLDASIPLLPGWVVPYLLALPWWLFSLLWAALFMPEGRFRALVLALSFCMLVGAAIYVLFPTYVSRPLLEGQGWEWQLLRFVYNSDRVYNAFPSSHTYLTSVICLFWWLWKPKLRLLWLAILVIVLFSTLFTGQHNLLDVLGGLSLAVIGSRLGIWGAAWLNTHYPKGL